MKKIFQSKEYRRTRNAYIVYCALEYCIMIFASDSLLAKLLSYIGIGDSLIGIISSLLTLTCMFQLLVLFSAKNKISVKKKSILFCMLCLWMFISLYLIPLMPFSKNILITAAVVCIVTAYFANYYVFPSLFVWANSFVAPESRAKYSAAKEMFSLVCGMAATFAAGYILEYAEAAGNIRRGFITVAVLGVGLSFMALASLLIMEDKKVKADISEQKISVKELTYYLGKNKSYRDIVIVTILWNAAVYLVLGYLGTYKIQELGISLGLVQIITMAASAARLIVSRPFGKFSDKKGYIVGMKNALCIVAIAFFACTFATAETWWLIIIFTILYNISLAGVTQNMFNVLYSYVDDKYLEGAMAVKNSIGGVCGFGAALLGGYILDAVQKNENTILGIQIYGQQLLAGISFVITIGLILYIHNIVEKRKVFMQ